MMYYLQILSAACNLTSVFLDTKRNILARPMSIVGILLGLPVYYQVGLYAKCLLNTSFVITNCYGLWQYWLRGKRQQHLAVTRLDFWTGLRLFVLGLVGAGVLGTCLSYVDQAHLVYWDALNFAFALIAQMLIIHMKLEGWLLWLALSTNYTVLCYCRGGLPWFGMIHMMYMGLSIKGYRAWRRVYYAGKA